MESIEVRAVAKYIRQSPQKVRRVINVIRGMDAVEALEYLKLMSQQASYPVQKVIKSAVANAEENYELHPNDLYIAAITADEAPTRRWRRFGARGRFKPIKRRYSHIKVILKERE